MREVAEIVVSVLGPRGMQPGGSIQPCPVGVGGAYAKAQGEAARRLRLAMGGPTVLVQHVWTLGLPVIKQLQGHVGMKVRRPV